MAAHLNPFLNENDLLENAIETKSTASEKERSPDFIPETETVSLDVVAAKLINDSFLLTALELHTELVESGRELHRLRDFFSNPANFERTKQVEPSPPGNLHRTSSCQTFDSLDFARYSDDGDRLESDRVAVLEFELRKAQETIKSLRQSLTRSAESELSTPESAIDGTGDFTSNEPPRPLERRALNFLINEYMLLNNYKLTSVTFSEENENQDFDDWDDVGLNLPKPASMLHLYREFSQHVTPAVQSHDFGCSVDLQPDDVTDKLNDLERVCEELTERLRVTEEQLQSTTAENKFLGQQLKNMERQVESARLLKSSTPMVSPIGTPSKTQYGQPPSGPRQTDGHPVGEGVWEEGVEPLRNGDEVDAMEPVHRTEGRHREEEGAEDGGEVEDTGDSLDVLAGTDLPSQDVTCQVSQLSSSVTGGANTENFQWHPSHRKMPATFQKALLDATFHVTQDNRIISEVTQITDSSGFRVVLMLARCLPHIVPNVLLAKREELIPLILCAATLHPDSTQRDQLLNILFNLIKRPDKEQRDMILTGCVAFAQHVGPSRAEAELLPQCWEQITHKYFERRLLVAEACGALTPYLPNEIRSSLVLSMLQQMLSDDKTEDVRATVVRSLGVLTGFIDDSDKFKQVCQLMLDTLSDVSEKVTSAVHQVFLPSFAMWALELGRVESDIVSYYVRKLDNLVEVALTSQVTSNSMTLPLDKVRFCQLLEMLRELIAPMFVSVLQSGPYVDRLDTTTDGAPLTRFPPVTSPLLSLSVMLGGDSRLSRLLQLYEVYISEEWYEPWEALNWVAGDFVPQMLNLINTLDVLDPVIVHSLCGFFYDLCRTFGHTFTVTKVKSKFSVVLSIPDDHQGAQVASGQTALTKCTVPVYAAGILGAFGESDDRSQLSGFLRDLLCTLSLHHAPLHSLSAALVQLSINPDYHELLLTVLWDGVVHPSADVRCTSAKMFELLVRGLKETLIGTRVVPALITLASDPEISVRIATIPALGIIMESGTDRAVLDKVHMQFQTFMDDPIYRDQHTVSVELIQMFARVAPNAEPKFREEFVLPRLAIVAASNNHAGNIACRKEIAMQLFEAYSALSCCFISDHLISVALLPGLRCLFRDMEQVAPDHAAVVTSMIREFECGNRGDANAHAERNNDMASSLSAAMGLPTDVTTDDMKAKMMSRFKDVKDRATQSRTNFSKIFGAKK